jgi:hypothetical protein
MNGHMEQYLLWNQVSMEQNMNNMCNSLAKTTVKRAVFVKKQQTHKRPRKNIKYKVGKSNFETTSYPMKGGQSDIW